MDGILNCTFSESRRQASRGKDIVILPSITHSLKHFLINQHTVIIFFLYLLQVLCCEQLSLCRLVAALSVTRCSDDWHVHLLGERSNEKRTKKHSAREKSPHQDIHNNRGFHCWYVFAIKHF